MECADATALALCDMLPDRLAVKETYLTEEAYCLLSSKVQDATGGS